MAEEAGEKTEAPTQRRREEAREQGQIARSADLTAAVLLLGFLLLMKGFGPKLIDALKLAMRTCLSEEALGNHELSALGGQFTPMLMALAGALAPLMVGGMVIGVAVNLAQVGFYFSGKRLMPKFGSLNPIEGVQRLFRFEGLLHVFMSLVKIVLVGWVAWSAVRGKLEQIIAVQGLGHEEAFWLGTGIVFSVGLRIGALLLILALIDYGFHRFKNERELRMTRQEVKEEMRRMEGDPKIKQRRRQLAMQMAVRSLQKNVPTADVVVTNPTHFAVALKYDDKTMHAPRVVAKGQDLMARRIREIAIASGVPILERKTLAQGLFRLCEVGKEIPEQFYSAVAEILAYVYEISGRRSRSEG